MNNRPQFFLFWLVLTAIFVAIFGIVTYQVESHSLYTSLFSILFFSSIFSTTVVLTLNYWLKFCPKNMESKSEVDYETTKKRFPVTITHVDGLPFKCKVSVNNALRKPTIETLHELTVVDFGGLRVTYSVGGHEVTVFVSDKNLTFHVTNGRGTSIAS